MTFLTIAGLVFLYLLVGMGYVELVLFLGTKVVQSLGLPFDVAKKVVNLSDGMRVVYVFLWPVLLVYAVLGYTVLTIKDKVFP